MRVDDVYPVLSVPHTGRRKAWEQHDDGDVAEWHTGDYIRLVMEYFRENPMEGSLSGKKSEKEEAAV